MPGRQVIVLQQWAADGLRIIGIWKAYFMDAEEPEPMEEYVPGVAGGRHYMARLRHLPRGPWSIAVIHIESLPPLHGGDTTWPMRDEAVQAADKLVADLGH